ncbi:MAG: protein kinase [Anaerolineae bacterium]
MALSDPLIGRMLGDYRVIDILGRGGMARVYRGYDPKLERYAAIKVIDAHLLNSQENEEEYRARFRREARAIARLNHPNIVSIYQYGEVDALYYMAMVFIEGRDLGHILKENAQRGLRLGVPQILRIIGDTASALDYAHQGGVIHRDVKPSNIMVTPDGHAVLTDFGLALSVPEGSIGNTFGSAHYIAPEQAVSSAQAVPQSDLYSLAIVLYQMLTGKVPFDDPSAMSVALKHISDPPPPLRRYAPDIPPAVEQVVLKALEKDVKKRYSDGQSLVAALEMAFAPILDALPASARFSGETASRSAIRRLSTDEIQKANKSLNDSSVERPTWTERIPIPPSMTKTPMLSTQSSLRAAIEATKVSEPPPHGPSVFSIITRLLVAVALVAVVFFLFSLWQDETARQAANAGTPTEVSEASVSASATAAAGLVAETSTAASLGLQPTATLEASATPADAATDTPVPTREPTQTPTPDGFSPTVTPEGDITPVPVVGDDTDPIVLLYDGQSLTLFNRTDQSVDISSLSFVRENQLGNEISFAANEWRPVTSGSYALPAGGCYQLWLISLPTQATPLYCRSRFGWIAVGTLRQFWISSEPNQTFEVRHNNQVLINCPTNSGECSIPLVP